MVPRLAVYGAASAALAGAVVGSALKTRANFFAAAVAVGRSNGSLLVRTTEQRLINEPVLTRARCWPTLVYSSQSVLESHSRLSFSDASGL
jgi:hypothetical protein